MRSASPLLFAVTLLLLICSHLSCANAQDAAAELWNKLRIVAAAVCFAVCLRLTWLSYPDQHRYRANMINLLSARYPMYANALAAQGSNTDPSSTILSIVTDPVEATWAYNAAELGKFAGYVPKFSSSFDLTDASEDGKLHNVYKALITSLPDTNAASQEFTRFSQAPKTYVESPHSESLASFQSRLAGAAGTEFSFTVNQQTTVQTVNTPWAYNTQQFTSMSSIVREVPAPNAQPAADSELNLAELIRRIVPQPVTVNVNKFNMDFSAAGVIGIPVKPSFVNRDFIRTYRSAFSGHWFGAGGRMCLLPSVIWVAMKPRVVLRLAETEFKQIQSHWTSGRIIGLAAGSVFFRNDAFRQLAESDTDNEILGELFHPEALDIMRETNDLQDSAQFRELSATESEDVAQFVVKQLEAEEALEEQEQDLLTLQDDETMSDSSFGASLIQKLIEQIQKQQQPPPPPVEKVYEAAFSSNSGIPQIIAITSDIL